MAYKDREDRRAQERKNYAENTEYRERKKKQERERYAANREQIKERNREYRSQKRASDPGYVDRESERRRENKLAHKYGLTKDQHEDMEKAQGGRCAICRRKRKLVVDHDHQTGATRGLLCQSCNVALGMLGDNLAGLQRAQRYLAKAKKRQQLDMFDSSTPSNISTI